MGGVSFFAGSLTEAFSVTAATIGSLLAAATVAAIGPTVVAFFSSNFGSIAAGIADLLSTVVIPFDCAAGFVADGASETSGVSTDPVFPLTDVSFSSTGPVGFLVEVVSEPGFVPSAFVELDDGLRDSGLVESSTCWEHCCPCASWYSARHCLPSSPSFCATAWH